MARNYPPLAMLAILAIAVAIVTVVPYGDWFGLILYLAVVAISAVLLYRVAVARVEPEFPAALFVLAIASKLLFSLIRYWTVVDYYGGGDAMGYHDQAVFLAPYFRALDLTILDWYAYMAEGTRNLSLIAGAVYAVLPANLPGAFFLFALLAFCGAVFFYLAARVAFPERSGGVYLLLIFFMPSVLFWPASLGKDAWVFFCSGFVMWGWVLFVRRHQVMGLLIAAAALVAVSTVRAHVAALLAVAMAASYFLYLSRNLRRLPVLLAGAAIVGIVVFNAVQAGVDFLQLEELSLEAIEDRYELQQLRTSQGGSEIAAVSAFSVEGMARGVVTVLLRPFPWEADDPQNLVAAAETTVWLGVFWVRRRAFVSNLAAIRRDPVLGLCLAYSVAVIFALTAISNLGIIARQRVMMLPFLWMLFL
jgi:hypothetical protein